MEKTIKYLENGEYHYATVKDVGDLAKLKTDSKDDLVTAINDLFENGGKNAGKPEGYDKLVDQMADTIKKQQDISGKLNSAENDLKQKIADSNSSNRTITDELNAQIEVERQKVEALRLAAEQAQKELNEQIAKLNTDSQELSKKTTDLANDVENKFGSVQNDYKTVSENLTNEAAALHKQLGDVKNEAEATKSRIQDQAEDIGNIHKTVDNVSNQVTQKIWMTDLDPVKQQVTQNSTEVQETQNQLKTKAEQSSLDLIANSVEKLDTEVKKNSEGLEVTVKKEEFAEDVAKLLKDKTNLLLGTRNFAGDKWSNLDHWHEEPGYWNGLKVYSSTSDWYGIQYQYEVKKGNQYTFSFYARQQSENNSAYIMLSEGSTGSQLACTEPYQKSDTHIGTEWKRYSLTFQAIADGTIYPRVEQSVTNNTIYVAGYKLELGKVATPWEPNEADVADNIERNESKFNVFSDKIEGVVKKQEQFGSSQTELETKVTQNAEGLKQASHQLEDANGKINKFQGDLESTAKGLKASYEEYTNKAIGQISDSSLNLIRNGSFSNKDSDFDQWQNVSAKVNIREDENGLRWAEITQSGMTTDNPQGVTSNYFTVKQGKVTVAVDIKSGDKATLDNESVLFLELYDNAKKRVDFHWVTLAELGLNKNLLNDHQVHRGLYRLAIDRTDVQYMTVKAYLIRNGDLWFTNFSARLSSIDDGGYTPNPDDLSQQILKMNTKIEEDAEHIALKANSVDVTRDIKDAVQNSNGGGVNLLKNSEGPFRPTGINTTTIADNYGIYDSSTVNMIQGQTYTVSGQTNGVWSGTHDPNTISDNCVLWLVNDQLSIIISANTMPHTFTWNYPTGVRKLRVNAYHKGDGNTIYAEKVKIERGTVATPWTPAPEDTSAEIKSAKDAAIQVASDQINIHVNELTTSFDDKLNKRVNEAKTASEKFTSDGIEQTVKKITDVKNDVNDIGDSLNKTGSRNLLHNTSDQYRTLTGSDWMGVHTSSEEYTSVSDYHTGDWFTYAATITNTSDVPVALQVWRCDMGNNRLANGLLGISPLVQPGQVNVRVSLTGQIDGETWNLQSAVYSSAGQGGQHTIQVKDERLVEGKLAGSWAPNPDDLNEKIDTQTLDSANIDDMRTQGHYFVKNLTGNPISGWVYVDVTGNGIDRVRQDVYADNDTRHMYRRLFGSSWSDWEQGAYLSDVNSLKTEVTASVKNLGDRVTTEVNSITTKVNSNNGGGINLLRGTGSEWKTLTGSVWFCQTTGAGAVELGSFTTGDTVTYSITVRNNSQYAVRPEIVGFSDDNGTRSFNISGTESVQPGETKTVSVSATVAENTVKIIGWLISSGSEPTFSVDAKNEKLERGSVATPWSPAPEDTAEAIKTLNTKWDVANGQIQGKVTATDVNNILNGKGYATQSWAESNFRMKSDSIELEVRKITDPISDKINGVNNRFDNLQVGGRNYLRDSDKTITGWGQDLGTIPHETLNELAGKTITVSCDVEWSGYAHDNSRQNRLGFEASVTGSDGHNYWIGAWKYPNTSSGKERISTQYTLPAGVTFAITNNGHNGYVAINGSGKVSHAKIEIGNRMTDWTPAPEDINEKIDTQTLDSANIDNMRTQGHYFVHNLTGNPTSGWVYVDVSGNGLDRIRQDVYQDSNATVHFHRKLFGNSWTPWEKEATQTDINNLRTETTASVKNLGDRVTTEVNSITTKINDSHTNDVELIRNNNFPDGNKGSWNGNLTTVIDGNSIPAELGQNGMKVLRVIQRDTYEDDIWYSVKPGEIFDVDYWIWPTGSYDSRLGLYFVDKDKGGSRWRGVVAKKGTGWTHYTGTIEAPSNAAFAKPWIWIDKDASETGSAAWIGKPSIRRHDTFAEKKISEINTKLDVANGQIQGKVTETQVNDILNGKGYATQSIVQSLIDQKAGTINESITRLDNTIKNGNENNVQLVKKSDFEDGDKGNWGAQTIVPATGAVPPAELGQEGMKVLQSNTRDCYEEGTWYSVKPGEKFDVDFWCAPSTVYNSNFGLVFFDKNKANPDWRGVATDHSGTWKHYAGTITAPANATFAKPWFQIDKPTDQANTSWLAKPSIRRQNTATVTQLQSITASLDGIKSTVNNKADTSTVNQLSNMIQSKVNSSDFNSSLTQLNNEISARVTKGDLLSQINLTAGKTIFQSNKIYLDASSVTFSGKAFIPSAAITNIDANTITSGVLNGIEFRQVPSNGRSIDIKDGNITISSNDPYAPRITFENSGKFTKLFNAVGDIEVLDQQFTLFNFTPEDKSSTSPIPFFKVTNVGQTGSGAAKLNMDHAIFTGNEWWTSAGGVTFGRTWNGIDTSSDYVDIYVKSVVPHSELSAKTKIKKLDRKFALSRIMQDEMYTYQFKEDIKAGSSKRYASFIIDNVNKVAQYNEPEEFLSANGRGRDDGTQLAYLIAAVQYQQEEIEKLKKKVEEK